jgi:potassium/hydrogen antiporter
MLRLAFWPAAVLATMGVALTAGILGLFISLVDGVPFAGALLAGAAAAPTDAAAVAVLLRRAGAALPERLLALLEVESGLNDPMSVFLTFLLLHLIARGPARSGRAVPCCCSSMRWQAAQRLAWLAVGCSPRR